MSDGIIGGEAILLQSGGLSSEEETFSLPGELLTVGVDGAIISLAAAETPSMTVTTVNGDIVDPEDGQISFAEAIGPYASYGGTVSFVSGLNGSSITYSGALQQAVRTVSVTGNGAANTVISGVDGGTLLVGSGNDMTFAEITMGSGLVVSSGGRVFLSNGTVLENAVVHSSGLITVSSGAVVNSINLDSYGSMYLSGGAVANSTTVDYWGWEFVFSGAMANDTTVMYGGEQRLNGGIAYRTVLNSWGTQFINSGGTAFDTLVNSGGNFYIGTGGTATGVVQASGGSLIHSVFAGDGVYITGTYDGSAGFLQSGGTATGFQVYGSQYIRSGGVAVSNTIYRGQQHIFAGGTAIDTVLISGGTLSVSGGTATNVTQALGAAIAHSVGAGDDIYISGIHNGTDVFLQSGGTATGFWIYAAVQQVNSGGVANSTTLNSGGRQNVYEGGVTVSTTVNSGGSQTLSGGMASNTVLNSFGRQLISSGGVAVSGAVKNGGSQVVYSDGAAIATTVSSGGTQHVSTGGLAVNTTVSGGTQYVSSGGTVQNVTVRSGGLIVLSSGSILSGVIIAGGSMSVNGTVDATQATLAFAINMRGQDKTMLVSNLNRLGAIGTVRIAIDSTQEGTYVLASGASLFSQSITLTVGVYLAGTLTVNGGTVSYDGRDYRLVRSGSTLSLEVSEAPSMTVTIAAGDIVDPTDGEISLAEAINVYASSGGTVGFVPGLNGSVVTYSGKLQQSIKDISISGNGAVETVISGVSGGTMIIGPDESMTLRDVTMGSGLGVRGSLYVRDAVTENVVVSIGGRQYVSSGGIANFTTVSAGGWQHVSSGGIANSTTVDRGGGKQEIYSGGVANFTTVNSNGSLGVRGGTVKNMILNSGGTAFIDAGATATDVKQEIGGLINTIVFAEDRRYITGIHNGSDSFMQSGGTATGFYLYNNASQTVSSGGVANSTILLGGRQVVSSGGVANATTISDGLQTISGGTANSTVVNSGGIQMIVSQGVANHTTVNHGGYLFLSNAGILRDAIISSGGTIFFNGSGGLSGAIVLAGSMNYTATGYTNAESAGLTFAVDLRGEDRTMFINNIANAGMFGSIAITVAGAQSGSYVLAGGAASFNQSITLTIDGSNAATLTVGGGAYHHAATAQFYTLVLADGTLSLKIDSSMTVTIADGDKIDPADDEVSLAEAIGVYASNGGTVGFIAGLNSSAVTYSGALQQSVSSVTISGNGAAETVISGVSGGQMVVGSATSMTLIDITAGSGLTVQSYGFLYVRSGAITNGALILGRQEVFSGGTANDTTVTSRGSQYLSGGTANNTHINIGGQFIYDNGVANDTVAGYAGSQIVSAGGTANRAIINSSGNQEVYFDGTANDTVLNSGGSLWVYSGGTANDTVLKSDGALRLSAGGTANHVMQEVGGKIFHDVYGNDDESYISGIHNGSDGFLLSGGTASGFHIYRGNQGIYSGGVANDTVLHYFGAQMVFDGGVANRTVVVDNNTWLVVSSGGVTNNAVLSAGVQIVSLGGMANDTVVSQGTLQVESGGIANNAVIRSGGRLNMLFEGTANHVIQEVGGAIAHSVYGGGSAYINGMHDGSDSFLLSGGTASGFHLYEEGTQSVNSGGVANATVIHSSARQGISSGGTANDTMVLSEGWQMVGLSGVAKNTVVSSGGSQVIGKGGIAENTIVKYGGFQTLSSAAIITGSHTVAGRMVVFEGANTADATITYALEERSEADDAIIFRINNFVSVGAFRITIDGDQTGIYKLGYSETTGGGSLQDITLVIDGAEATTLTVNGGIYYAANGNSYSLVYANRYLSLVVEVAELPSLVVTISGDIVDRQDFEYSLREAMEVYSPRLADSSGVATVSFALKEGESMPVTYSGVLHQAVSGIILSGNGAAETVVSGVSGGIMEVRRGESMTLQDITMGSGLVISGGTLFVSDAVTEGTVVSNGRQTLLGGGVANSTTIDYYGVQHISSGGVANDATVTYAGNQHIYSGGTANSTLVNGMQYVSGGEINYTTVKDGHVHVSAGMMNHTKVSGGGVYLHGTANDTTLMSHGFLYVYSGATANFTTVADWATLTVNVGGMVSSTTVGNFGFLAVSGVARNTLLESGGVMQMMSGGTATDLVQEVGGRFNQSVYAGDNNYVTGIHNGSDHFLHSGGTASGFHIYQAQQSVYSGGVTDHTTLQYGGSQFISSEGTVNFTTVNSFGIQWVDRGGVANNTTVNSGGSQNVGGGMANGTTINSDGEQQVAWGGMASSTTVNSGGVQFVHSSGTVKDTTVNSGGELRLRDGATLAETILLAGSMFMYYDNETVDASTAEIVLAVDRRGEDRTMFIDHLDYLGAIASVAITIAGTQEGTYVLAGAASAFSQGITLTVDGVSAGTLTVNDNYVTYGDKRYFLVVDSEGTMSLEIVNSEAASLVVTISGDIVDNFDYECSLREAVEIYAPDLVDSSGVATVTFDLKEGESMPVTLGGDLTAVADTVIDGAGAATVNGGALYGDGHSVTFKSLTWNSNVLGGARNRSVDGGTKVVLSGATISNTVDGYATGGSEVVGRMIYNHIDGDVVLQVTDTTFAGRSRTVGAGYVDAGILRISGDVNISLENSTIRAFYGTAWIVNGGSVMIDGDVNITVDLGSKSSSGFYAGSYVVDGISRIAGSVNTTIESGSFTNFVGNGSQLQSGTSHQGSSTLTINGGTFSRVVYAGGYSGGGFSYVDGDTYLQITGGTFSGTVYGGSYASSDEYGNRTYVDGSTNILIDSSVNNLTFSDYIYAGNAGNGVINGSTNITFTGRGGDSLKFGAGSTVSGECQKSREKNNYVNGEKNLVFDDFSGDFNALLVGFSTFTIRGSSQVNYTMGSGSNRLADVKAWNFEVNAGNKDAGVLVWDGGINNFEGDTFELGFLSSLLGAGESAMVLDGTNAEVLTGWEGMSVKFSIDGAAAQMASWDGDLNGYVYNSQWLLTADTDNHDLILKKLS